MTAAAKIKRNPTFEHDRFFNALQPCLTAQSHLDIFLWLQGDVQAYLPHDILLVAWGDPNLASVKIDVISSLPGMRTEAALDCGIVPLLQDLFAQWKQTRYDLFCMSRPDGFELESHCPGPVGTGLRTMRSALAHGIRDERGSYHCLYIAFSREESPAAFASHYLRMLVPHIDTALRQVNQYSQGVLEQKPAEQADPTDSNPYGLTEREWEIMAWVSAGKTNEVIGMILSISPFTVKNHLKRIFQKLGVSNRAQAVSKL